MNVKIAIAFAVMLALPCAASAQTAKACLTQAETEALAIYTLPSAIRAATGKCMATLQATAALIQSGPVIAARYQFDADKAWPDARAAFDKAAGMELTRLLGEVAAKSLVDSAIGTGLAGRLKANDCNKVDRMIDILEPLPARNMAMLMVAFLEFGMAGKPGSAPFRICAQPGDGK